jgi:hypothetical protein
MSQRRAKQLRRQNRRPPSFLEHAFSSFWILPFTVLFYLSTLLLFVHAVTRIESLWVEVPSLLRFAIMLFSIWAFWFPFRGIFKDQASFESRLRYSYICLGLFLVCLLGSIATLFV